MYLDDGVLHGTLDDAGVDIGIEYLWEDGEHIKAHVIILYLRELKGKHHWYNMPDLVEIEWLSIAPLQRK